jgi:hypothetical protein
MNDLDQVFIKSKVFTGICLRNVEGGWKINLEDEYRGVHKMSHNFGDKNRIDLPRDPLTFFGILFVTSTILLRLSDSNNQGSDPGIPG